MMRQLLLIAVFFLSLTTASAEDKIRLWQGTSVHANSVTLEIFKPLKPFEPLEPRSIEPLEPRSIEPIKPAPAIIVCPGGSYCWHDYETEGKLVAEWLQKNGIAAFVLNYRVQGVFNYVTHLRLLTGGNHHPYMMQDAQRALQYVREHAAEYNIDVNRVGVMGFSAGGHLSMSTAEFFHTDFLKPLGIETKVSLRPDFVAPVYPVVSMSDKCTHKRSRRALLGETKKYNRQMRDSLSLEKNVPADCPPVFLVNCVDDPVVKYHNSELLDSALTARHIPHKYIQYKTGGHGFGASDSKGTAECRQWRQEFLNWLKNDN